MTKRQRIREAVVQAKKDHALGGARTAALDDIRAKYDISPGQLKAMMVSLPGGDYWN